MRSFSAHEGGLLFSGCFHLQLLSWECLSFVSRLNSVSVCECVKLSRQYMSMYAGENTPKHTHTHMDTKSMCDRQKQTYLQQAGGSKA